MGTPHRILRIAELEGYDLIVIGAKGHTLLDRLLVGSVCETVMHHAPCPVLILHHKSIHTPSTRRYVRGFFP